MLKSDVTITARTLNASDSVVLMALDEKIFPAQMLMSQSDYEHLASIENNILVEARAGEEVVGVAFGFPAEAVQSDVQENDALFEPREKELYSYSVGVLPAFQKSGIGQMLTIALADEAHKRGFAFLSAHVRMRTGWAKTRKFLLLPIATRIIAGEDYWGDKHEDMEYQLVDLSKPR